MSTGTWAACVLVISLLNSRRLLASSEAAQALLEVQWSVFWLLVGALVVLCVTGGFYLRHKRLTATTGKERAIRIRLLWQKHILLLLVYGVGTVWMLILLHR